MHRELKGPSDEDIAAAMDTLQTTGFINYYGMQRFGNSSVPTHAIGLALLRGDWQEAARMVLCEKDGDSDDLRAARRAWNVDHDAKQALRNMPRWAVAERSMLEFYSKASNAENHNGALSRIPKNLRMMYVHAYQSYVWNSAVSERIKQYGCDKPIAGDLVYDESAATIQEEAEAASLPTKITQESLQATSKIAKVRVLKEDDLDSYQIQDVVLPLPGYSVTYPEGDLGALYRNMLKADGLDADEMFRKQKEYSLGGAYRKMLTRPKNVSWEILRYSERDEDLLQADEDKLLGIELVTQPGDRRALKVEFDLDTASYATMALREILKVETGNVQQRAFSEKQPEG
jgi:tRNA pseudouridine13 synthase